MSSSDSDDETDEKLEGSLKLLLKNLNREPAGEEIVQNIAKLQWKFEAITDYTEEKVKYLCVYVGCNTESESFVWSCVAEVKFVLLNRLKKGTNNNVIKTMEHEYKYSYNGNNSVGIELLKWEDVVKTENGFVKDGCIILEAHVKIVNIRGFRVTPSIDFTKTYPLSDCILLIENIRVHVVKAFLAMYSPYFLALFSENFSEHQMKEIPIKDVDFEEFLELLRVIYPSRKSVTAKNVEYILKLADRFQIETVTDNCEQFLISAGDVSLMKKLLLAGRYCLSKLEDDCIKHFESTEEIVDLREEEEYADLSDKIKLSLLEKIMTFERNKE